jgi:predicted SnoaL-like aldol condensation-catalyzing enzyme
MDETTLAQRNKQLISQSIEEFVGGNIEILRALLVEDFIEHSPGNPSGRDAFMAFIADSPVTTAHLDIKRVIADDEYAVVHYRMVPAGSDREIAVVDIWRLADGQIVEHWDVVQPVPEAARIPNGMF